MNSEDFLLFLKNIHTKPLRILDASIPNSKYIAIDLSENNTDLNLFDISSSQAWEAYIRNYVSENNKQVAFGGYLEKRNIYKRSSYFNQQNEEDERNIHVGVDLWIAAGSKVIAPLDGRVHSFKNNTNFGDYGPTIILKHSIDKEVFYTLYGHLSEASIADLKVGKFFPAGDTIGSLGDASVNGDYAPHVHFQIIRDIENNYGDFAGVCNKKNLDKFMANCPDPNTLLKLKG